MKAVRTTSAMRSRSVVCPYCGHKMLTVYVGTTGYIQTKCNESLMALWNALFRQCVSKNALSVIPSASQIRSMVSIFS